MQRQLVSAAAAPGNGSSSDEELLFASDGGSDESSDQVSLKPTAVESAAFLINQAADGVERPPVLNTRCARRSFRLHLELVPVARLCCWGLVALTFFEEPRWCLLHYDRTGQHVCGSKMYPSYHIPHFSKTKALATELLLASIIILDSILVGFAHGFNHAVYLQVKYLRARILCLSLLVCDSVYSFYFPLHVWQVGAYLRIVLAVLYSTGTRKRLALVFRTLPGIMTTFTFAFLYILFFAWVGVIVFPPGTKEGAMFFNGLGSGMWTLLICLTTANFPDLMMPAYEKNRDVVVFFCFFIIVGIYFLLNVITGITLKTYQECKQQDDAQFQEFRARCVVAAYDGLKAEGDVTQLTLRLFFEELNNYKDIKHIASHHAEVLIGYIDSDGDGVVDEAEFKGIMDHLTRAIDVDHPPPFLERNFPGILKLRCWRFLRDLVHKDRLDTTMDVLLVGVFISNVIQTWDDIIGRKPEGARDLGWKPVQAIICWVFFAEALLYILVLGWSKYWSSNKRKFDFLVTVVTVAVTVYVMLPTPVNDPKLVRTVATARVLRLLRLLDRVPGYRIIVGTFVAILPDAIDVAKVMFCAMYCFSVLGNQLFGGVINTDPEDPNSKPLASTAYAADNYYPNNFNDMPSGMVLLFELLVVNNWFVMVDAHTLVTTPCARAFFVTWWIVGVLICLNVVVSFIIQGFLTEYEKHCTTVKSEDGTHIGSAGFVGDHLIKRRGTSVDVEW